MYKNEKKFDFTFYGWTSKAIWISTSSSPETPEISNRPKMQEERTLCQMINNK